MTTTERTTKTHTNPDGSAVEVPSNCEIGEHVEIKESDKISSDTFGGSEEGIKIGDYAKIGYDVAIETGVEIGAETIIDSSAEIGIYTKIGSDVYIGSGVVIGRGANIGSRTVIGSDAWIDSDVVLPPGSAIPANSVVTNRNVVVPPHMKEDSNPA